MNSGLGLGLAAFPNSILCHSRPRTLTVKQIYFSMFILLRGTILPIFNRAAPGPVLHQWIAHLHSTPCQYAKRSSGQRQKKPSSELYSSSMPFYNETTIHVEALLPPAEN
jgi:hypothetical protein